jgi:hypothetical protein
MKGLAGHGRIRLGKYMKRRLIYMTWEIYEETFDIYDLGNL